MGKKEPQPDLLTKLSFVEVGIPWEDVFRRSFRLETEARNKRGDDIERFGQ